MKLFQHCFLFVEKLPYAAYVLFCSAYVANGEPERDLVIKPRMRDVGLTGRIDTVHDLFVERIKTRGAFGLILTFDARASAKTDKAERNRRQHFPIR